VLRLLIHLDFVLAVALLVVAPLGLLVAAWGQPAVRSRLLAYWRASSLLMITVYLMIDGRPAAFVTGNAALLLIPLALYYGDLLSGATHRSLDGGLVAGRFRRWRTVATIFCGASLLLTGPALRCAWALGEAASGCAAWLRPPRKLHRALHPSLDPAMLGDAAIVGLVVYGAYLIASVVQGLRRIQRK
jgi:hypothetical protein